MVNTTERRCPMCKGTGRLKAHYGDCVRELRRARNITQDELARHLGYSRGSIANIETGRQTVDPLILIALANYFDVSTDYLLGRKEASS